MKVQQYYAKNQFHIHNGTTEYLQSYNSLVVKVEYVRKDSNLPIKLIPIITLGYDWDYSTTTSKYVYLFLEEYGEISFIGIKNKRAYVNRLIKDGKVMYNENMR